MPIAVLLNNPNIRERKRERAKAMVVAFTLTNCYANALTLSIHSIRISRLVRKYKCLVSRKPAACACIGGQKCLCIFFGTFISTSSFRSVQCMNRCKGHGLKLVNSFFSCYYCCSMDDRFTINNAYTEYVRG